MGGGEPLSTPGTALKKTGSSAPLAGLWREHPGWLLHPPLLLSINQSGRKRAKQENDARPPPPELEQLEGMGGPPGLVLPRNGVQRLPGAPPWPSPQGPLHPHDRGARPGIVHKMVRHEGTWALGPPGPPALPLRPSAGAIGPRAAGDGRSCLSSALPPRARSSRTGRSGERAGDRQCERLGPGGEVPT